MGYNGSGTFLVNTSGQPVVSATTISSSVFNALTADLGVGLSTCITKDGQTATTARIPFIFGINSSLTTDSTSTGSGSIITAGGVGITKALWVGGLANIAGALTVTGHVTLEGVTSTGATGTGLLVFSASPTLSGTLSAAAGSFSSTLQSTTYLSTSGILYMGGTTASEISLRRLTSRLQARLGDDSGFCDFEAGYLFSGSAILYLGGSTSGHVSLRQSSGQLRVRLGDDSGFANVNAKDLIVVPGNVFFNGGTATDLLLKRSSTTLLVRKGDDSADGGVTCGNLTTTGAVNIGGGASGTFVTSVTVANGIVISGV